MFGPSAIVLTLVSFAAAYGGYGDSSPPLSSTTQVASSAVPSAPPSTDTQINVNVLPDGDFTFSPQSFNASKGSFVTFFFPDSQFAHSVTQSSFASPCTHLAANGSTPQGFDSGLTTSKQFTITIEDDTQPIWFFCKQGPPSHCGIGMIGAINAPATGNTFDMFKASAMALGDSAPFEDDKGAVTGGVNGVATAPPTAAASTSSGSGSDSGSDGAGSLNVWISSALAMAVASLLVVLNK